MLIVKSFEQPEDNEVICGKCLLYTKWSSSTDKSTCSIDYECINMFNILTSKPSYSQFYFLASLSVNQWSVCYEIASSRWIKLLKTRNARNG